MCIFVLFSLIILCTKTWHIGISYFVLKSYIYCLGNSINYFWVTTHIYVYSEYNIMSKIKSLNLWIRDFFIYNIYVYINNVLSSPTSTRRWSRFSSINLRLVYYISTIHKNTMAFIFIWWIVNVFNLRFNNCIGIRK